VPKFPITPLFLSTSPYENKSYPRTWARTISSKSGAISRYLNKNQRHNIYKAGKKQFKSVKNNNIVVNLSDRILTLQKTLTLNKGPNFGLTSDNFKKSIKNYKKNISLFIRKLQIKYNKIIYRQQ